MVYRKHARDVERDDRSDDPTQTLLAYDASGRRGRNGQHGEDGASALRTGADGESGYDAGPAARGRDSGSIEVTLTRGPHDGSVAIGGTRKDHRGKGLGIRDELDFGDMGFIDLLARGGRGGHGGNGGHGGDGATGSSGSNASRYSSGGDGGRGGDGGDGGDASSGAHGGHGGGVLVAVAPEDTHLLMLLRHAVEGGDGGRPGKNGAGGGRGRGGSGGSSYSWTETESYTDAQGNSQSRTTYHSNPGGSDGASGRGGSSGNARAKQGKHGKRGRPRVGRAVGGGGGGHRAAPPPPTGVLHWWPASSPSSPSASTRRQSVADRLPRPQVLEHLIQLEATNPSRVTGVDGVLAPNISSRYGLRDLRASDPLRPEPFARLMGVLGEPPTILGGPLTAGAGGSVRRVGGGLALTPPGRELVGLGAGVRRPRRGHLVEPAAPCPRCGWSGRGGSRSRMTLGHCSRFSRSWTSRPRRW